jgi:hypothetical protein
MLANIAVLVVNAVDIHERLKMLAITAQLRGIDDDIVVTHRGELLEVKFRTIIAFRKLIFTRSGTASPREHVGESSV